MTNMKKFMKVVIPVLLIISLVANIYLYNENKNLEREKILLSNNYVEKHADMLRLAVSDVEGVSSNLDKLEMFIQRCEESIMYYRVSVAPINGEIIKGHNSNIMTAANYDIRLDHLRWYYSLNTYEDSPITAEVTAKDVNMIVSDFVTVNSWLQERLKEEQLYYYDDGVFETEVLNQLQWSEKKEIME